MRNFWVYGFVVAVSVFLSLTFSQRDKRENVSYQESVYERVMRTKTIRCGYFVEAPFTYYDHKKDGYHGIAIDLVRMIAKDHNLKIEFVEEINFATFGQDLKNGRYDMVCGGVFVLPRGGINDYSNSYAQVPVYGYVRADNGSFDKPFDQINWSHVKISGIDGEGATTAAQRIYPEAKMIILPQLSSISEMLMAVHAGKADIGFVMPPVFEQFKKTNSTLLKKAELGRPLYKYEVSFPIKHGETEFKALINNAIRQYKTSGELASLHKKYDPKGLIDFFE